MEFGWGELPVWSEWADWVVCSGVDMRAHSGICWLGWSGLHYTCEIPLWGEAWEHLQVESSIAPQAHSPSNLLDFPVYLVFCGNFRCSWQCRCPSISRGVKGMAWGVFLFIGPEVTALRWAKGTRVSYTNDVGALLWRLQDVPGRELATSRQTS